MVVKVWNFLLPASGTHQLRVEEVGTPGQRVFLDGHVLAAGGGSHFPGPENSSLEVRSEGRHWLLLVNGLAVEDYDAAKRSTGDESLRGLKSKPDGSYLISPHFEATEVMLNIVRKFRFQASGDVHEVQLAHKDCIWQVIVDGVFVDRVAHTIQDNSGEARFEIPTAGGQRVGGAVHAEWASDGAARKHKWQYALVVNDVEVPASWTKQEGAAQAPAAATEVMRPGGGGDDAPAGCAAPPEAPLPQGVSFDRASGAYHANVRGRSGKFVFLGEFGTPGAAHQRYLEALPVHCPERHITPDLLT
mmetsp:Transcript_33034/g.92770  ORF Transcript_33034/g.92770 Transcript_33034/m.92770 type:complete len:303 (+) Transcript_33034:74-982(+)